MADCALVLVSRGGNTGQPNAKPAGEDAKGYKNGTEKPARKPNALLKRN